jgi:hypothetical protein
VAFEDVCRAGVTFRPYAIRVPRQLRDNRFRLLLIFVAITGCLRSSRDMAVLAPLAPAYTHGFPGDSIQPEYIAFSDRLTASVLKSVRRNSSYRIVPAGTSLLCPSNRAPGMHGYALGVRVVSILGDSGIAVTDRRCENILIGENHLLRRRGGAWLIDKVLNGFRVITPMMLRSIDRTMQP